MRTCQGWRIALGTAGLTMSLVVLTFAQETPPAASPEPSRPRQTCRPRQGSRSWPEGRSTRLLPNPLPAPRMHRRSWRKSRRTRSRSCRPIRSPQGEHIVWMPGYWSWDEERKDYLWVSGFWRSPPPGRQWTPGHWKDTTGGWQWAPGFWAGAPQAQQAQPGQQPAVQQVTYLPPPPAPAQTAPSTPAPGADYTYVPGCWVYRGASYNWQPGYWVANRPNWVWVPSHYVWTPCGYVFVGGYWDYSLRDRGLLFAPVYVTRIAVRPARLLLHAGLCGPGPVPLRRRCSCARIQRLLLRRLFWSRLSWKLCRLVRLPGRLLSRSAVHLLQLAKSGQSRLGGQHSDRLCEHLRRPCCPAAAHLGRAKHHCAEYCHQQHHDRQQYERAQYHGRKQFHADAVEPGEIGEPSTGLDGGTAIPSTSGPTSSASECRPWPDRGAGPRQGSGADQADRPAADRLDELAAHTLRSSRSPFFNARCRRTWRKPNYQWTAGRAGRSPGFHASWRSSSDHCQPGGERNYTCEPPHDNPSAQASGQEAGPPFSGTMTLPKPFVVFGLCRRLPRGRIHSFRGAFC